VGVWKHRDKFVMEVTDTSGRNLMNELPYLLIVKQRLQVDLLK